MIDAVGRFGADIASTLILIMTFAGATWLAVKSAERLPEPRSEKRGALLLGLLMIAWLIALSFLTWPASRTLKSYACSRAQDYVACMDPPDPPDWL